MARRNERVRPIRESVRFKRMSWRGRQSTCEEGCSCLVLIGEVVDPRRSYQSSAVVVCIRTAPPVGYLPVHAYGEAIGDYLRENLASVYHERDASIHRTQFGPSSCAAQ